MDRLSMLGKGAITFLALIFYLSAYSQSDKVDSMDSFETSVRWKNKMISYQEYQEEIKREREKIVRKELKEKRKEEKKEEEKKIRLRM